MASKKKSVKPGNRASKAAMAVDRKLPGGIKVRELTLGIGGLLDEIGSPFMDGRKPKHLSDMFPTFFVMTRPAFESQALLMQGQEVFDAAVWAWADTLPCTVCSALSKACAESKARLDAVSGAGGSEKNSRSAGTAG